MKKYIILFSIITLSIIVYLSLNFGCSKKSGPIEGEITFISGTLKVNNIDGVVGGRILKDDVLVTGEKSESVIQISETALITLRSNTEVKFENMFGNKDEAETASIMLNQGSTFHKVSKIGTNYSVKTPTSVAAVRGTSFGIDADNSNSKINVETGTVYVRMIPGKARADKNLTENQNKGLEDITLTAGQSLEIKAVNPGKGNIFTTGNANDINSTSDVNVESQSENSSNSEIAYSGTKKLTEEKIDNSVTVKKNKILSNKVKPAKVSTTDNIKESSAYVGGEGEDTTPDPEEVKKLIKKKDPKLEDIKSVFNRMDKIYLYSGETLTGAIIERGDVYSIITPDGVVKVSKKDIQGNEIIR